MQHTYEEVPRIVPQLPRYQRIQLADDLLGELLEDTGFDDPPSSDAEIEASWKAEGVRRIVEADAGRGASVFWEEVEAPLRARSDSSNRPIAGFA